MRYSAGEYPSRIGRIMQEAREAVPNHRTFGDLHVDESQHQPVTWCLCSHEPLSWLIIPHPTLPALADPRDNSSINSALNSDSDLAFVAKLVAVSFAGGAAIKYGSLLSPLAFSQSDVLAVAMVFVPPTIYAAMLLTRPGDGSK